jgi:16S rRNA (cytidine1402-2'-O)-methyltransferase
MSTPGSLVLVPNTLDLGAETVDIQAVLPLLVLQRAARIQHWAAEDARSTRSFLKRVDAVVPLAVPLQAMNIVELPKPRKGSRERVPAAEWHALLAPALQGLELGLISEAGLPAVADPGSALVMAAQTAGVPVDVLAGPSSLMLALAGSGLNGQSFAFVGYLPQDALARSARLKELETLSRRLGQTQIFIETPYRNAAMLAAGLEALSGSTLFTVACGLTLPGGWVRTERVAQWKQHVPRPSLPDRWPAVFALLAG